MYMFKKTKVFTGQEKRFLSDKMSCMYRFLKEGKAAQKKTNIVPAEE